MAIKSAKFFYDKVLDGSTNNLVYLVKPGKDKDDTKVLAKGFITQESFEIGVRNNWGKVGLPGLSGSIGDWMNDKRSLAAGWAASADKSLDVIEGIAKRLGADGITSEDNPLASIGEFFGGFENLIHKLVEGSQKFLSYSVDSADAYMRIFNGTDIDIPLSFDEYLITDGISSGGTSNDIYKQLEERLRNFAGHFSSADIAGGFVGFTHAPGGFTTNLDALKSDASPDGTYVMYYNGYRFRGLLISNMGLEVSTTRVKISQSETRPLYIKIHYDLTPAVKYSTSDFTKWFKGINNVIPE